MLSYRQAQKIYKLIGKELLKGSLGMGVSDSEVRPRGGRTHHGGAIPYSFARKLENQTE
jgi:hypothetical protein